MVLQHDYTDFEKMIALIKFEYRNPKLRVRMTKRVGVPLVGTLEGAQDRATTRVAPTGRIERGTHNKDINALKHGQIQPAVD